MYRNLTLTSFLGLIAIILGAFGAHALKEQLSPQAFNSFETAIRYQFYHVIILLIVNMYKGFSEKIKNWVSLFLILGIILFSGSIYAITIVGISAKSIWFITPLGGLLLILGWGILCIHFLKKASK